MADTVEQHERNVGAKLRFYAGQLYGSQIGKSESEVEKHITLAADAMLKAATMLDGIRTEIKDA